MLTIGDLPQELESGFEVYHRKVCFMKLLLLSLQALMLLCIDLVSGLTVMFVWNGCPCGVCTWRSACVERC